MQKVMEKERDPLNLSSLPQIAPPVDGWPEIKAALIQDQQNQHQQKRRFTRFAGSALAAAAVVTLAIGLFIHQPESNLAVAPTASPMASAAGSAQPLESLISLSQQMENRVRTFRTEIGGMPTNSLVYQVELEDLIAQVDNELSIQPDSVELWSQRVNLLLDLSRLYQNELRRDYRRMASL